MERVFGADIRVVKEYQSAKICREWLKCFDIDVSTYFNGLESFKLVECVTTGLQFFDPSSLEGTESLYRNLSRLPWYYGRPDRWEYREALKVVQGTVLEIGCGDAFFLGRAKEKGCDVYGIEKETSRIPVSMREYVTDHDFFDYAKTHENFFDAIFAFQVLEHVSNVEGFLSATLSLLKKGGYLVLTVPNRDSFIKNDDNGLLDMPPHHMSRWNDKVFLNLQRFFPLTVEQVKFEPLEPYHIQWYVNIALQRWPVCRRFIRPFLNILLRLGLRKLIRGHTLYVELTKI
ncbi:class I SAM-dependent methyltransferase [Oligoflexia bacterium]|nr:class I SAM-dependent methyltransferase [Oligoflexia bacterium]